MGRQVIARSGYRSASPEPDQPFALEPPEGTADGADPGGRTIMATVRESFADLDRLGLLDADTRAAFAQLLDDPEP